MVTEPVFSINDQFLHFSLAVIVNIDVICFVAAKHEKIKRPHRFEELYFAVELRDTFCFSWSAPSTRNEAVPLALRLLHGDELLDVLLRLLVGVELRVILPAAWLTPGEALNSGLPVQGSLSLRSSVFPVRVKQCKMYITQKSKLAYLWKSSSFQYSFQSSLPGLAPGSFQSRSGD